MKIMDKKGILFNRIHIIDSLVIVALIVGGLMFGISFFGNGEIEVKPPAEMVTVEATFLSYPYRQEFLESYHVGDKLAKDKTYLNGSVISTEIIDTYISLIDNNGIEVTDVHPYLKRARVTVRVELERDQPIIFFKGAEMVINENHFLTTETSDLSFKLEGYTILGE